MLKALKLMKKFISWFHDDSKNNIHNIKRFLKFVGVSFIVNKYKICMTDNQTSKTSVSTSFTVNKYEMCKVDIRTTKPKLC